MSYLKRVAGIDLGTTNSCVCVYKHERVDVVQGDNGSRTFPSCVSFTDTGRVYGQNAKKKISSNYKNTVYDVKRLIGHSFNDPVVQEDIKSWPFTVKANSKGAPVVEVSYLGKKEEYLPEMISSFFLEYLIQRANQFTGEDISDIVITVPAYFNDSQRRATIDAGKIAGYNVLTVLNEPTAAAIAYGFDNQSDDTHILVYDLGGGTFDATLLHLQNRNFTVVGTDGDTHLGGDDLDVIMMDLLIENAQSIGTSIDRNNKRLMSQIRKRAEEAKIMLSQVTECDIDDDFLGADEEPFVVTRDQFVKRSGNSFNKTITIIDRLLASSGVSESQVNNVVLIGGSSRIPYVKEILSRKFGEERVFENINPDEAVAKGACIYGVKLMNEKYKDMESESESESESDSEEGMCTDRNNDFYAPVDINEITIRDVLPLSIGVKNAEQMMCVILPKNTPYGESSYKEFITAKDNARRMKIHVGQGERARFEDNYEIGTMIFTFPPMPRGAITVRIELSTDPNGVLTVKASDNLNNNSIEHVFEGKSTYLSNDDIIAMKRKAEEMKKVDEEFKQKAQLLNDIEELVYQVEKVYKEYGDSYDTQYKEDVENFLMSIHEVLKVRDYDIQQLEDYKATTEQWFEAVRVFLVC